MAARTTLRGRDDELAAVGSLLAGVARGRGGVLVVRGPPGSGKTTLLEEARAMAGRSGVRVGEARAFRARQSIPFAPLLGALFEGSPPLLEIEALHRLSGRADQRYWLVRELQSLIERATRDQPLLVVIDDGQWADDATLLALRTLPAGLAGARIGWVLAARSGEPVRELDATVRFLATGGASVLGLGALAGHAVAGVVDDVLGPDADPALAELAATAGGDPYWLAELLGGLRDEGRVAIRHGPAELRGAGGSVPRRVRLALEARLEQLRPETSKVVRVAGVLGREFSVELLARLLDRPATALVGPVDEAIGAGLLTEADGRLAFAHELVHAAVLATLPEALQRALRRQAADALRRAGAGPVAVAAHLSASAEPGDAAAIATLRSAARALSATDAVRAADLSLRALELTPAEDAARGPLVAETVSLLYAALRVGEAEQLAAASLERTLPPEHEAQVRLSLGGLNVRSSDARAADNRRALALDGLAPRTRARHLAALAFNLMTAGSFREADELIGPALESASACGDDAALGVAGFAKAGLEQTRGRFGPALDLLRESRRHLIAAGRRTDARALDVTCARVLADLGRREEALALSAAGVAAAERDGHAWLLRLWRVWRSHLLLEEGRLAEARVAAELGGDAGDAAGETLPQAYATLVAGRVALHTGDVKALAAAVARARVLHDDGNAKVRRFAAWLLALAAIARDDPDDAVRWLEDDELPYAVPLAPPQVTHPVAVVRIALAAGDTALARDAVAMADVYARENPASALLVAGAAHARALLAGDLGGLLDAVELHRDAGDPLARAAALEDAGAALAQAGRRAEAIRVTDGALDAWVRVGATADAARVRRQLRELGVRRRAAGQPRASGGWDGLTAAELTVVRLVADGRTNREAADGLFLSPHTVSSHLRHAFTKLGVNSRVELARIVVEHDVARAAGR